MSCTAPSCGCTALDIMYRNAPLYIGLVLDVTKRMAGNTVLDRSRMAQHIMLFKGGRR